jgi:antitoxin ParD1/3/4
MRATVGKHFEDMIQGLVQSGRYPSADAVVSEGLRLVEACRAWHRTALEAGGQNPRRGRAGG